MSTTDTRAAFEEWSKREGALNLMPARMDECEDGRFPATYHYAPTETAWRAFANSRSYWQTEAAKATGTAELPPLPEPTASTPYGGHLYSLDKMLAFAHAAIHKRWCAEVNCDAVREELAELKAARQPAPVIIDYSVLLTYSNEKRIPYNELCSTVHAATNRSQP